jgi:hypothetical protein
MFIVIMEWDGKKPPTTFYNRMHTMGLYVHGSKDERALSPLVRRTPKNLRDTGLENIICQEGCFVCVSEKMARWVSSEARTHGATNIQIVQGHEVESNLTEEDAKIWKQIEDKLGRRGRPSGVATKWVITCFEECVSSEIEDALYAVNCPACHSPFQRSRPGEMNSFKLPDGDVFEAWLRHRFATGQFEIPALGDELPPVLPALDPLEASIIDKMRASKRLVSEIMAVDAKDRNQAVRMLDAVFTGRAYISKTVRDESRLRAALDLYQKGVDQSRVSILEDANQYDLIDGAHIAPLRVAGLWFAMLR